MESAGTAAYLYIKREYRKNAVKLETKARQRRRRLGKCM